MTETTSWVGQTLSRGRYRVLRKLGEGGMAFVLLAHDNNVGVDVVLKVPRPIILAEPEFALRFQREIRSMVQLAHPHIVKITDVGEHEGLPYYVMDLLTGGSLEDRFRRRADGTKVPMPPDSLGDWLEEVARALDFIHRQGFVHRDIKPANILFDATRNAYVSDFGIVKVISDSSNKKKQTVMTQAGMVLGTGNYMAPEVSLGERYDGRADQYALAVTVYEVLSGRVPFGGGTLQAIILKQTTEQVAPLHELVPTLPRVLSQVVEKGLSQDPRKRYADCTAFCRAVLAAVKGVRTTGRPAAGVAEAGPQVPCRRCGKLVLLRPAPEGKWVTCPSCGARYTMARKPPEQEMVETSRAAQPGAKTGVAQLRESSPVAASLEPGERPAGLLRRLAKTISSRRIWLIIALAIVLGALGLGIIITMLVVFLGKRPSANRPNA